MAMRTYFISALCLIKVFLGGNNLKRFVCASNSHNSFNELYKPNKNYIDTPKEFHFNHENISDLALTMKKGSWVNLPFCSTLEAELLGASVSLNYPGAMITDSTYSDLNHIPLALNFQSKRFHAMVLALNDLRNENIIYNIEGPFTILSALVDLKTIFKSMRNQKSTFDFIMNFITDFIVLYGKLVYEKGVKILSFGDPLGTIDIIGPKVFKDVYKHYCLNVLSRLHEQCPDATIHICGKLTQNLLDSNCCNIKEYVSLNSTTYGESLLEYTKIPGHSPFLGLNCINCIDAPLNKLTILNFN